MLFTYSCGAPLSRPSARKRPTSPNRLKMRLKRWLIPPFLLHPNYNTPTDRPAPPNHCSHHLPPLSEYRHTYIQDNKHLYEMRYMHKQLHICCFYIFCFYFIKDHNTSNKSSLFFISNFHLLYCLGILLLYFFRTLSFAFLFFSFFDNHIYISSFLLIISVFCPCSSMSCVFRKCFCDSKSSPIWMPKKKSNGHVVYKHRSR